MPLILLLTTPDVKCRKKSGFCRERSRAFASLQLYPIVLYRIQVIAAQAAQEQLWGLGSQLSGQLIIKGDSKSNCCAAN